MGKISGIAPGQSDGSDQHRIMAESFAELGWEVLQLGGAAETPRQVEIDFVLAHAGIGIALVDLMRPHREPVARLRAKLDAIGFSRAFPGHLPIIHRVLGIDDLWRLSMALDPDFASQPPMEIAGREWIALVQQALLLEPTATPHRPPAATPQPAMESWNPAEPVSEPPESSDAPPPVRAAEHVDDAPAPPEASEAVEERDAHWPARTEAPLEVPRGASDAPPSVGEPESFSRPEAEHVGEAPAQPEVAEFVEVAEAPPPPLPPRIEAPAELPPAIEEAAPRPAPSRSGRTGWWLFLATGLAATIGLSHHFSWPLEWRAEPLQVERQDGDLQSIRGASAEGPTATTEGDEVPAVAQPSREPVVAEQVPVSAIPLTEARNATPRPEAMDPLPEEEAPLLDLFVPLSVPSPEPQDVSATGEIPQRAPQLRLPTAEEVRLVPAQPAAAPIIPEEIAAPARIAVAAAPAPSQPIGMAGAPSNLAALTITPEAAATGVEFTEILVPLPDPAVAADAAPIPSRPIEADRAPAPAPERPVTAFPPVVPPTLPAAVIEMLIARGDDMLSRGDISGARLLYARAASAGSAAAARAMARSFEADVLNRLGVRGIRPDPEQARQWYQRAEETR